MSDLSQTPGSVATSGLPSTIYGTANAAVVAGNVVAKDSSGQWGPASAGSTAALSGTLGVGIALDSAPGVGQQFQIWTGGQINLGATLSQGEVYVVSKNGSGKISPDSDLVAGNYVTVLGIAVSSTILQSYGGINVSGVTHF